MEEIKPDNVNHPAHYEVGGYECEKVMEAVFGKGEVAIWSKLNAFKYLWRCDHKQMTPTEDIEKADWYLKNYIRLMGKQKMYEYGMRLRPFSIGCQPMGGLIDVKPETTTGGKHYWNVLVYKRELTEKELKDYELDDLNK